MGLGISEYYPIIGCPTFVQGASPREQRRSRQFHWSEVCVDPPGNIGGLLLEVRGCARTEAAWKGNFQYPRKHLAEAAVCCPPLSLAHVSSPAAHPLLQGQAVVPTGQPLTHYYCSIMYLRMSWERGRGLILKPSGWLSYLQTEWP